ncbi:hypothetical protein [Candidatus Pelagibacter sp. HIMB1509]|uniref:hypothetical protein n=1 Tax=Candidatus Pelagibacter sp. HIMB1509 TaxID=3413339 RepID=UPI003F850ADC
MELNKLYKSTNIILIIFIIFLLGQAFDQSFGWGMNKVYPEIYFMTFGTKNEGWNQFIWFENGLIETIQIIILLITILILLNLYLLRKKILKSTLIEKFIIIELIGLTYFFFEEISWGQHFINFDTLKFFLDRNNFFYNHQGEMNLHNTSRVFNEFPRIFVILWCSLSIIIFRLTKLRNLKELKIIITPNIKLILISYLLLIFIIPDLLLTKLGMVDFSKLHIYENEIFKGFNLTTMFSVILSFNFFRLSELQELLFVYYFMWHSLFLRNLYFK